MSSTELSELAQIDSITLLEPGMMIYEDDHCQPFPDQILRSLSEVSFLLVFCFVCLISCFTSTVNS